LPPQAAISREVGPSTAAGHGLTRAPGAPPQRWPAVDPNRCLLGNARSTGNSLRAAHRSPTHAPKPSPRRPPGSCD
jgi:hypothetical protein